MTKEILPLFQWIIIVIAGGLCYPLLAPVFNTQCGFSKLWSAIVAYLAIALVVFFIFAAIKKPLMPRLTGSNIFGNAEYYLGIPSGIIRYFCITIFVLALINAKHYTAGEIAAKKAYNERWYGGGIYSGDYIPDLHTAQDSIFKKSFTGPYLKNYLGMLLIETGAGGPDNGPASKAPTPVIHIGN